MQTAYERYQYNIQDLFNATTLLIKTNPGDTHLWSNLRDIFTTGQQMDLSLLVRHQIFPAEAFQWNRMQLEAYCDIRILMINPNSGLTWSALGDAFSAGVEFESLKVPGKTTFFTRHLQNGDIRTWKKTDYVAYCDAQALSIAPNRAEVWVNLANGFKNLASYSKLAISSQNKLFSADAKVWNTEKCLSYCYHQVKSIFSNANSTSLNEFFNHKERRLTPQNPIGLHPSLIIRLEEKAQTTPMNTQRCPTFFHGNQLINTNKNAPLSQLYREPVRQPKFRELEKIEIVGSSAPSNYRASANTSFMNDLSVVPPRVQQQSFEPGFFLMPSANQQVQLCEDKNAQPYLRNKRAYPFNPYDQRALVEQPPTQKKFRQNRQVDVALQQYNTRSYSLTENHLHQEVQTVPWREQGSESNLPHLNETVFEQPLVIRNFVNIQPVVISFDSDLHSPNHITQYNAPVLRNSKYVYQNGSSVPPVEESNIVSKKHGIGVRYFLHGEPVFMREKHKRALYHKNYEILNKNQYVDSKGDAIPENEIANVVKSASGKYFLHGEKVMTQRAHRRKLNRQQHNARILESIATNFQTPKSNTSQDLATIRVHNEPLFSNPIASPNPEAAEQILPEIIQEKPNELSFFQLPSEFDSELSYRNNGSPSLFEFF